MTRVLALAGQSKIGCITQRRFAKAGTKTHSQRGAALDRNGLSVSTETACRFEPKSPVGNSEICTRASPDLQISGAALRTKRPEARELVATLGSRHHGEAAERAHEVKRLALAGLPRILAEPDDAP